MTFKVLPAAETQASLVVRGLSEERAAYVMAAAMGSSAEVSGAAHLPASVTGRVANGALRGSPSTVLRLEGFATSVAYRLESLKTMLGGEGDLHLLDRDWSATVWRDIRDCAPFAATPAKPVWRVSMAPTQSWRMIDELRRHAGVDAFYDWQGGLAWLQMEAEPEADALRGLIARHGGGHATLVRATPAVRAAIPVFQPQPDALAALAARLKDQFDPHGILNPGRMG